MISRSLLLGSLLLLHDLAGGPTLCLAGVPNFSAMKCEACEALADELDMTLRAEASSIEGRQDMLAGGRLDSKGKRRGRVVNYEMSELRAMEVLERLCVGIKHYRTVENAEDDGGARAGKFWFSKMETYHDRGTIEIPEPEHEEMNKRSLKNFCGSLVEENEEAITVLIQRFKPIEERRDWLISTPLHKELCVNISKHCAAAYLKGGLGWYRRDPIYQKLLVKNTKLGELLPRFGDAPPRIAGTTDSDADNKQQMMNQAMDKAIGDAKKLSGGKMVSDAEDEEQQKMQDAVNKLKKKGGKKSKKKKKKKKARKKKAAAAKEEL
jgi:hypothetical protein